MNNAEIKKNSEVPLYCLNETTHDELEIPPRKALILMYLAGDSNSIADNLKENIKSVSQALSNENLIPIKAIALFDDNHSDDNKSATQYTRLYEICKSSFGYDNISSYTKELSYEADFLYDRNNGILRNLNTGNGNTLCSFMTWALDYYKNDFDFSKDAFILVIGSHGAGSSGQNYISRTSCPDYNYNTQYFYWIETDEMQAAFKNAGFSENKKIDLLIYDVCNGSTIEEFYEYSPYVKSIIASIDHMPGRGIPYETFISSLEKNNSINTIGKKITENFKNIYIHDKDLYNYTIGFYDLTKIKEIETLTSNLADYLLQHKEYFPLLETLSITEKKFYYPAEAIYSSTESVMSPFYDFGFLVEKIYSMAINNNDFILCEISQKLLQKLSDLTICSWKKDDNSNDRYNMINHTYNFYGIGITFLSANRIAPPKNYETDFAFNRDTNWYKLLKSLTEYK